MINKILFTIFAIVALWKGFAMLSRLSKSAGTPPSRAAKTPRQPAPASPASIELVPCPRCGAYVDPREPCRCRTQGA